MKRIFFFIGVFFVALWECNGQNPTLQDVVYLKNGSVIKGTVIEQIMDSIIKVELVDGSLFVFNTDEIEKISKQIFEPIEIKKNTFPSLFIGGHIMGGFPLYFAYISGNLNGVYAREDIKSIFSTLPTFGLGFTIEYRFRKAFGLEINLSYYSKGGKMNFQGAGSTSYRTHSIVLPLHCLIYFGDKPTSFLLDFGLSPGVLLAAYTNSSIYSPNGTFYNNIKENSTPEFNRFSLGINGGIGVYGVRFNVIWEPSNLWSQAFENVVCTGAGITNGSFNTKTVSFMLSYTHKFNLKEKTKFAFVEK